MTIYLSTDPIVISSGNQKIGKIPNVSLPPILSCVRDIPCAQEGLCYSLKSWRAYPNVRDARLHNWRVWKTRPHKYFRQIGEFIESNKPNYFRFHVDGDIPHEKYFHKMTELADDYPNTRFLSFTKRFELPINKCPTNLTIIPSAWPGLKMPKFTRIAWMNDGREDRYMHARFDCHGACDECYACWHIYEIGKDVVFTKH
jgi:hypothetical protein